MRCLSLLLLLLAPTLAGAESVTFRRVAAAEGDVLDQSVRTQMRLEQTGRRGGEVLDQRDAEQRRTQRRRVAATAVAGGLVTAARVDFLESTRTVDGESEADPIRGKSYLCRREDDTLRVTTPDGLTPPIAEYEMVSRAMDSLGKPNPLADFLAGRSVAVGERLELPAEVAQQALGLDRRLGAVDRFVLTLRSVEGGVAAFDAHIEAVGYGGQQMRLFADGSFAIEAATCLTTHADLSGPVAMSSTVGDYTVDARGKMRLALESRRGAATTTR